MNRIKRDSSYEKDYVDLASFVEYFKGDELEGLRSRIKGEFPYLEI